MNICEQYFKPFIFDALTIPRLHIVDLCNVSSYSCTKTHTNIVPNIIYQRCSRELACATCFQIIIIRLTDLYNKYKLVLLCMNDIRSILYQVFPREIIGDIANNLVK